MKLKIRACFGLPVATTNINKFEHASNKTHTDDVVTRNVIMWYFYGTWSKPTGTDTDYGYRKTKPGSISCVCTTID